jgi:pimeloyl-ACP methyl ester carboxylesterase
MAGRPYTRIPLRNDTVQWEFDRAVKETGRSEHFFTGRKLPESVRTQAMISKHLARPALRLERLARTEEGAGHVRTALELYIEASSGYADAQHAIFEDTTEKRLLHGAALRCYRAVMRLAPVPITHVSIPWRDSVVSGYLHLADSDGPAPLVFLIPGCDQTKERLPHPLMNWATQRGMHLFVFDGPGQGESNQRGIVLTRDNYEDAVVTALTHLLETRPEIDASRLGLFGMSFGSYWAARVAAREPRFGATVLMWASVCDKRHLFDGGVSPRYRQLFAYLIRAESEAELDAFIDEMTLDDAVSQIQSPTLLTLGEFDPRSPLEEALSFFDRLTAPAELWIFADQQHMVSLRGSHGVVAVGSGSNALGMDWLRDRLDGKPLARAGEVVYIEGGGLGPNDPAAARKRHWYEGTDLETFAAEL